MDRSEIVEVIRNGDERGMMPAFRNLTEEQIDKMLSYLATLKGETSKEFSKTNVAALSAEGKAEKLGQVLRCPCGCEAILQTCQCATARKIRNSLLQGFREGKSVEGAKAAVINEYGHQVLPVSEIPEPLSSEEFTKIPRSYEIAREIPEVLSQVPCFCACARLGHRNLLDCFKSTHGSSFGEKSHDHKTCIVAEPRFFFHHYIACLVAERRRRKSD
jgi:hypothetical protein